MVTKEDDVRKKVEPLAPSLWPWMTQQVRSLKGGAFLFVSLASGGWNLYVLLGMLHWNTHNIFMSLCAVQSLMILVIAASICFGKHPKSYVQHPRGSAAVDQFWIWWPYVWLSWLILYVVLTVYEHVLATSSAETSVGWYKIALDFFNGLSTLVLLRLYYVLAQQSLPASVSPPCSGPGFLDT